MVTEKRLYQLYERGIDGAGIKVSALVGEVGVDQVVAALRNGSIILPDETTGNLPDASRRIRGGLP